jgi:HCOMODA/2-hydroxy-3-carboxy-muconic semialdehyde decarboxylase
MWLLAAACDVYLAARAVRETIGSALGTPFSVTPLSADEIASWRAVQDELLPRLWQHLRRQP